MNHPREMKDHFQRIENLDKENSDLKVRIAKLEAFAKTYGELRLVESDIDKVFERLYLRRLVNDLHNDAMKS